MLHKLRWQRRDKPAVACAKCSVWANTLQLDLLSESSSSLHFPLPGTHTSLLEQAVSLCPPAVSPSTGGTCWCSPLPCLHLLCLMKQRYYSDKGCSFPPPPALCSTAACLLNFCKPHEQIRSGAVWVRYPCYYEDATDWNAIQMFWWDANHYRAAAENQTSCFSLAQRWRKKQEHSLLLTKYGSQVYPVSSTLVGGDLNLWPGARTSAPISSWDLCLHSWHAGNKQTRGAYHF